ncbi:MAG: MBL fold metallo-hydrolase [Candidatus Omnitrophota bacterium]|nr:MBL fold metallo-hydrolase [Candidatus Omnitrophota bacterium]
MRYILEAVAVGPVEVNCYILGCAKTLEAVIIDPGAEDGKIKGRLSRNRLSARYIINTHGHADHIGANGRFGLPIMIHRSDVPFFSNPAKNLSAILGMAISSPPASRVLEDGDKLYVGDLLLEVIHTPGHTPGSISVKCEDLVFTGDALFNEGIGRTDFPYSSEEDLLRSIREKLLVLPDSTKVYPGHGAATTIGYEKEHNPFI